MSTSNSTNFATNRDSLIAGALRLVGGIGQGETPTTAQVNEAAESLNMMAKGWEKYGCFLWSKKRTTIPLAAGTQSYRIGNGQVINIGKPLRVYEAYRHNTSSGIDIPVRVVSQKTYEELPNKTQSGYINQVYYDKQKDYGDLYVYLVPDATVAAQETLIITHQRPFDDFDSSTDEPDFPQEWYEALKYGLAVRLAGEYGLDRGARRDLKDDFKEIFDSTLSGDMEDTSLFFQIERWGR